ncbi:rust resistance kinase Lr10-like [Magnolia sinica]|uniref:rust resistance kinase Lr10-like n=1 Tax=Magnolia sinica TaxID=86752 RepID=UPI002658A1D4|nr:rust resistance kinase Lr10-like [Magnolia sinica]
MARLEKETFLLFFFILLISIDAAEASKGDCLNSKCSDSGPEIRFPFRLKSQPQHCGYPGFELSCKGNHTVLDLPYSGEFYLNSIDYEFGVLYIEDPDGCLARRLLSRPLNLSSSIFYGSSNYYYTIMNCPSPHSINQMVYTVSCLNSPGHYVYAINDWNTMGQMLNLSCNNTGTIAFDIPYLGLTWVSRNDIPRCRECEFQNRRCRFKSSGTSNETECYVWPPKGGWLKPLIIGVCIGGFVILAAAVATIKVYSMWKTDLKREKENQIKIEKFLKEYKYLKPTRYTYADIKRMTKQFKRKLGRGGFGSVFKGKLRNGTLVAVKVLEKYKGNGEDFINEVSTIGKIHHINVVSLLGFCAEGSNRALVYEFMPNRSLDKFIFSVVENTRVLLGWEKLCDIAIGIGRGIEYLHQGCDQRILHFDIKPHNILLDDNFNPKISDFGLAKLCSKVESVVSMTAARGTMGYIAPEVFSRNFGNVSYKSDVYSFGMLLLEMVGGRKNIDAQVENASQVYFPEWIYNRLIQGEEMGIRVEVEGDVEIAKKLTVVALWCIQWYPVDRPSMKNVIQMLEGGLGSLNMPPNPFPSNAPPPPPKTTTPSHENPHQSVLTVISEIE